MTRLNDRKKPSWKFETHPHTGNLAVSCRAFSRFADGEIEERQEVEDIGKRGVQAVVVDRMVVPDLIQARHCTRRRCGTRVGMSALWSEFNEQRKNDCAGGRTLLDDSLV